MVDALLPRGNYMRGRVQNLGRQSRRAPSPGFTLLELLAVILIITVVSVIALPTVLPALAHRQGSEAGRVLQGALVGARDKAIHDGRPSGIRLLPDPAFFHGTAVVGDRKGQDGNARPITVPA